MKLYVVVKKFKNNEWNSCYLEIENKGVVINLYVSKDKIMQLLDITYSQYYDLLKNEIRKEIN